MEVDNYFSVGICWKDLGLLDYFNALGINVCKLSLK